MMKGFFELKLSFIIYCFSYEIIGIICMTWLQLCVSKTTYKLGLYGMTWLVKMDEITVLYGICAWQQHSHSATKDCKRKCFGWWTLVWWPVIAIDSVEGLRKSEKQQDDSGNEGEGGPWIVEVVMLQTGTPSIPPVVVVAVYILRQTRKITVIDIENHLLTKSVK